MTANKRSSILWTVAGAIALMVPGYLLTNSSDPTPMRADASHTMTCERGQRASYRLRTVSDITMTATSAAHQETTATLELFVLGVDGTAAEFGFRFAAVDFTTDGVRDAARATAMATPLVVRFEQGNVVESRFPDGLADTTRRQLDALIRTFQCTLPPGSEPVLAIEEDGLGRYRAEYAWTSPVTVSRRKTAYLSGMAAGGVPCDVRIIDSQA
jgi:hypothetical protein